MTEIEILNQIFHTQNIQKIKCCIPLGKFDNHGRCNRLKVTMADYADGNGVYWSTGQSKEGSTIITPSHSVNSNQNLGRTISSRLVYKHVDLNLDR